MSNYLQTNEALDDLRRLADPAQQHRSQSDLELLELYLAVDMPCAVDLLVAVSASPYWQSEPVCFKSTWQQAREASGLLIFIKRTRQSIAVCLTSVVARPCQIPKSRHLSVEKQACLQQVV